ncbi:MAG: hypothetical protein CYPHOPRED_005951, partial [Cyphobasidiales sp. Tagirdzhanova-0007]
MPSLPRLNTLFIIAILCIFFRATQALPPYANITSYEAASSLPTSPSNEPAASPFPGGKGFAIPTTTTGLPATLTKREKWDNICRHCPDKTAITSFKNSRKILTNNNHHYRHAKPTHMTTTKKRVIK